MDQIDWKIIEILQKNARITLSQLSKKVHLTAPAVSERILKLQEKEIISGYKAILNLKQLGCQVICFVKVDIARDKEEKFIQFCRIHDQILECHLISGKSSFLVKVGAYSIASLETFLKRFHDFGHTESHIVLEEIFKDKIVRKPLEEA